MEIRRRTIVGDVVSGASAFVRLGRGRLIFNEDGRRRRRGHRCCFIFQSSFHLVFLLLSLCFLFIIGGIQLVTTIPAITHRNGVRGSEAVDDERSSMIYAIGLVRHTDDIPQEMVKWLAEINCHHNVGLHILAGDGGNDASSQTNHAFVRRLRSGNGQHCSTRAPVYIVGETGAINLGKSSSTINRIERIALLRDFQREALNRSQLFVNRGDREEEKEKESSAIIVIDLDLAAILNSPEDVVEVARGIISAPSSSINDKKGTGDDHSLPYEGICAAGATAAVEKEPWYYDTYSTVLLPDTYVHPLQRRLIKSFYEGEDRSLVRSDDRNGSWTQGDIMRWFQRGAKESIHGVVPVRSCFGGLAIYRASTYLDMSCRYSATPQGLERYASKADHRPCEHIVFHDCWHAQHSRSGNHRLGVMPRLMTLWSRDGKK